MMPINFFVIQSHYNKIAITFKIQALNLTNLKSSCSDSVQMID